MKYSLVFFAAAAAFVGAAEAAATNATMLALLKAEAKANKNADAGVKSAATGGKGGVDAATGETLLALPAASAFCKSTKETLADGTQIKAGDCSSLPQGQIPSTSNMVSTLIVNPLYTDTITADKSFNVTIRTVGLQTGFFTDAEKEYYTQPQSLNTAGQIKGHQHITIQALGNATAPPDPNTKVFFKGLNTVADAAGLLSVAVPPLNVSGIYRICSMSSSFSHQPVVMPIAQRGAQDDCIRITVANGADVASNTNSTVANAAVTGTNDAVGVSGGTIATSSVAADAAASTGAAASVASADSAASAASTDAAASAASTDAATTAASTDAAASGSSPATVSSTDGSASTGSSSTGASTTAASGSTSSATSSGTGANASVLAIIDAMLKDLNDLKPLAN